MSKYSYIDTSYILDLADNDNEFITDIISDFLSIVPDSISKLDEAVKDASLEQVNFYAHKLKGSFRFIGSNKVGDILFNIEEAAKNELTYDYAGEFKKVQDIYSTVEDELKDFIASLQ